MATLHITQVKSSNGSSKKQLETLQDPSASARSARSTEREDHPTVRGLIHAVQHLVKVSDG